MGSENIGELKSELGNPEEEEEEENFVEIEGKEGKFKEDPEKPGEALLDENDEPIPFEEKEEEGFVEIDEKKFKEDPEKPGEALLDESGKPIPFKEEEGGEKFTMPDKFKGKKPEEIAKSYNELEKMIEKKAQEKAEEIIKKGKVKEEEKPEKEPEEIKPPMTKDGKPDFSKMNPNLFVKWILQEIDKKAEEKARKIYDSSSKARDDVKNDIKETQKDHPLLKVNKEYTELVIAIISSMAAEGKTISLKEACEKVDAFKGGKSKDEISKEEKAKLKKAKAQVETGAEATPGGEPETEEKKIKEKLLGGSKGPLGGLGI